MKESRVNRSQKTATVEEIRAKAQPASIAVVTNFQGMPVEELTKLRVKIREAGGDYLVVKNTLARLAFNGGTHDVIKDQFKENCGVALGSSDPMPVVKALTDFAKTSKKFAVRHASLEGKFLTAANVAELARLPGRPELLAQTLGTMNAVPTNFVSLFANVIRGMLYALKAIEEQKAA
jgi:large subunit ribosomal protein L10